MPENAYMAMEKVVTDCVEAHSTIGKDVFLQLKTEAFQETKYFLPADETSECRWLTVGVGGDTMAEKLFLKRYSKCRLYGIEASPDQYSDYQQFGTIIPHAVGPRAGNITMRLQQGNMQQHKNKYSNIVVPVKPLAEVLDQYVNARILHFATLDIEGGEIEILRSLQKGELLDKEKVIFCQMDVEIHGDIVIANRAEFRDFDFQKFWTNFITNSPYVPIIAKPFLKHHRKVTFIHTTEPICIDYLKLEQHFPDR